MDNFIEILKNWGIPKVIDVTEIQEEVYRVLCEGDKEYILKVRNYFEKIKTEYELLSHLLENGIKVPIPLKTIENNFFFNISKNKYCLYAYIEGSHIKYDYKEDNREVIYLYGAALGKLHNKLNTYTGITDNIIDMNLDKNILNWAIPTISKFNEKSRAREIIEAIYDDLKEIFDKLPKQFIHRDPHGENLLFKDNKLAGIIDFDICMIGYKSFDLCYLVLYPLINEFHSEDNRIKWIGLIPEFIKGYKSENVLSQAEESSFWYMFLSIEMIFTAYFYDQNDYSQADTALECLYWIFDNKCSIESAG